MPKTMKVVFLAAIFFLIEDTDATESTPNGNNN